MRRLLIGFVILLGLLAIADRVGVVVANHAVAKQVRSEMELPDDPSVHISGFPFLTQALRGKYRDVHVQIPAVTSGTLRNVDVDAHLRGVHAPLSDLAGGKIDELPVDQVTGTVLVHYDDLARASGVPGLSIQPVNGGLQVSGQVAILGRTISVSAVAHVSVRNETLVVTADNATINGSPAPAGVVDAAIRGLSFQVAARALPLGLRITDVATGPNAATVSGHADHVVLSRGLLAGVA